MTTTRRAVLGAAWATPVILAATAAPAAAASQTPVIVPLSPCETGQLVIEPLPGQEFKGNNGNGFTLVKGDGLFIHNRSLTAALVLPVVLWTSAHQEGARLTTSSGDTLLVAPKDGNKASTTITLNPGETRTVRIVVDHSSAEAHLVIDCARFIFKAVQ